MKENSVIKIDVDSVLKQRLKKQYKFIPKFIIRWIERTICQDKLNKLLEYNEGRDNADFCQGVLEHLNVTYNIHGENNLPPINKRRLVFVCNHPLGALDGIILIDYISRKYGDNVKFVVNDLLMAVKPLEGVFLPINKHGKQSRKSLTAIDEAFAGNDPIIIFPAGLVSRRQKKGIIKDLKWRKMFISKCVEYNRDIIPMYFDAENSSFFYKFAKLRTLIGIKFNIEMIYLPREIFLCENKHFTIYMGKPIAVETLSAGKDASIHAENIKEIVYNLRKI